MYFQQFLNQLHGCASYLIASRKTRDAIVVDPSSETEQYGEILQLRGFQLRYVIDTHIHADHVSGARELAARHDAKLCLHESAQTQYSYQPLRDGDEIELGQLRLRVWHTPGHRPELIALLIMNLVRTAKTCFALTSDCLLAGDVGRPDFGSGDAAEQYASVKRLLRLQDWVAVFPGHFEGPCGKSMSGEPSTTIGYEREYNPLTCLDRDHFISAISADVGARPLNMVAIEATNRGVADLPWAMLMSRPRVIEIDAGELEQHRDDAVLLDVREPEEYASGHVPAAINLPQAEIASRLNEVPHDCPLFLICRTGSRSRRAAQFLTQVGYEQVRNIQGGTEAWSMAGKPIVRE